MNSNNNSERENDSPLDQAFEYVAGTLRGDARQHFEKALIDDESLQAEVRFWEHQLMSLNVADDVAPDPATWAAIQKRLHKPVVTETMRKAWTAGILKGLGAAVVVLVVVSAFYWLQPSSQLNADYVAVLTDEAGQARLTAITGADGETLWLQWGHSNGAATDSLPQEASWQLWAVSRRDGESRTVALFEGSTPGQVLLTETTLRLIRDASHLVLTLEEEGGSAIDEPSDDVLARGECVRLQVSPS